MSEPAAGSDHRGLFMSWRPSLAHVGEYIKPPTNFLGSGVCPVNIQEASSGRRHVIETVMATVGFEIPVSAFCHRFASIPVISERILYRPRTFFKASPDGASMASTKRSYIDSTLHSMSIFHPM